ncbi:MAG: lytic transglycosylase domain-containing protein [Chitinophagaceae bacterium]|nr:lytic transglycosylase domain-containing protein [Chitinophagaceae bacterium]
MLKKKLLLACFIMGSFILVAVASGSISAGKRIVRPGNKTVHQFDSTGLCTCIPFTASTELTNAPRIQINTNAVAFVTAYNKKNGLFIDKAAKKVQSYFTIIDSALAQNDMPAELRYLAFIESGLQRNASSASGAIGPWALMPAAAKQYGLKISGKKDERLDYYKSTVAAAKLLNDLYAQYGDWILVIAAYNSGPAWIDKAIKRSGSRDYWKLQNFLPVQTRGHIKRFIAMHYHFEGHGSLLTMTKAETEAHIKAVEVFTEKQKEIEKTDSISTAAML